MSVVDKEGGVTVDMEKLGDKLREKGLSDLTSKNIFRGNARFTEGIAHLERAADQYRNAEAWHKAAETYGDLCSYYRKHFLTGKKADEVAVALPTLAKYLEEAGDCYEMVDHKIAVKYWNESCYAKKETNNFSGAAMLYKRIAKIEMERQDIKRVVECFNDAYEAYVACDSKTAAAMCLVQRSQYQAEKTDYLDAAEGFLRVVKEGVQTHENTTNLWRSALCLFVFGALQSDISQLRIAERDYPILVSDWPHSQERRVLLKLMDCFDKGMNTKGQEKVFAKICYDFNRGYPLDPWSTKMLLTVKRVLMGEVIHSDDDDDSDEDGEEEESEDEEGDGKDGEQESKRSGTSKQGHKTTRVTSVATVSSPASSPTHSVNSINNSMNNSINSQVTSPISSQGAPSSRRTESLSEQVGMSSALDDDLAGIMDGLDIDDGNTRTTTTATTTSSSSTNITNTNVSDDTNPFGDDEISTPATTTTTTTTTPPFATSSHDTNDTTEMFPGEEEEMRESNVEGVVSPTDTNTTPGSGEEAKKKKKKKKAKAPQTQSELIADLLA